MDEPSFSQAPAGIQPFRVRGSPPSPTPSDPAQPDKALVKGGLPTQPKSLSAWTRPDGRRPEGPTGPILSQGGRDPSQGRGGAGVKLACRLLGLYQAFSVEVLGPRCRFVPSCSSYSQESLLRYGLWRGGWKTLRRLVKCHPLSGGGFDPVR
jgi:putative membrane protein insertion efficiency factor